MDICHGKKIIHTLIDSVVTLYFGITEEEDDSEEDEHTVRIRWEVFLEPKKSKVKQEMEKLKKVQKDKKNESQRKEKKSPKSKAANVEVEKGTMKMRLETFNM